MGNKVKILFIEEVSGLGGSTICGINLLRSLPADVFVKSAITYFDISKNFDINGIGIKNIYELNKEFLAFKSSSFNYIGFWLNGFWRTVKTCAIIKKENPDFVHVNNSLGINFFSILAARLSRVPCVAHVRNFEEFYKTQRISARLVSRVIAISKSVFDFMPDKVKTKATIIYDGLLKEEIINHHNTYPIKTSLGLKEQNRVVGFVGMLNRWKGADVFIRAFRNIASNHPDVFGVIFGDEVGIPSGYKEELLALVTELGLEERLIFAGLRNDIQLIYPSLDVVVHASLTPEPFGRVILEAMAAACPVIATNIGGPKELIENGVTGMLYQPGNYQELSNIVNDLLDRPRIASHMGEAARRYVINNFTLENTTQQTMKVYEDVIATL